MIPFSRIAYVLGILLCHSFASFSQLDTLHYIPAVHEGFPTAIQGAFYISTPSPNPVSFTLTNGAGTVLATGNVSNASPFRYQMNGVNANALLPVADLNTPITNAGFIVRAAAPVYANLRYIGNSSNQSFSITSKGTRAFGTSFRIAHALADSATASRTVVSVMATENNTQVTIDLSGTNITLLGTPSSTAAPITFTLNQGQSYHIGLNNGTNGVNRNNMIGRLITANRPIVTVMGNYLGCFVPGNHDIGLDQPVAENLLGTSYAFLQGVGSNDKERVMIVANQNGTEVYLNGNPIPDTTLNAGEHYEIAGSNYTADSVMFVQTSQPAYAWQILFGRNSWANWGLNFVPPVSCLTERFVDLIPAIDSVGTQTFTGNLNIITFAGSTVLVNGAPPGTLPIPIPGSNFEAYRIHGLTGSYRISSSTIAVVGFYGARGPSSYAGYFSGFDSIPEIFASITDTVCPDTLFVTSGFDSYQWLFNGSQIPMANDTFVPLNGNTGAFNVIVTKGSCIDTSGTYTIACVLPTLLDYFQIDCEDERVSWQLSNPEGLTSLTYAVSPDGNTWLTRSAFALTPTDNAFQEPLLPEDRGKLIRIEGIDGNGNRIPLHTAWIDCEGDQGLRLWTAPHPAQGKAHLHLAGLAGSAELEIWTQAGKLWARDAVAARSGDILQLDLNLPAGVYVLRLLAGNAQRSLRFTVW